MKRSKRKITPEKIRKLYKRRLFRAMKRSRLSMDEAGRAFYLAGKIMREATLAINHFRIAGLTTLKKSLETENDTVIQ